MIKIGQFSPVFISLMVAASLSAAPAFAQGKRAAAPRRTTQGTTRIGISGPIALVNGEPFWGGYVSVLYEAVPRLMVGLETGFQHWSDSSATAKASLFNIPVLATLLYRFRLGVGFYPFLGAGLGVGIVHASVTTGGSTLTGTEAKFHALGHVGAMLGRRGKVFLDCRVGLLESEVLIAPSLGFFL